MEKKIVALLDTTLKANGQIISNFEIEAEKRRGEIKIIEGSDNPMRRRQSSIIPMISA